MRLLGADGCALLVCNAGDLEWYLQGGFRSGRGESTQRPHVRPALICKHFPVGSAGVCHYKSCLVKTQKVA